ncbi:MAG: hypothetical protein AABZ43_00640 [Planctomycetota bacterium]
MNFTPKQHLELGNYIKYIDEILHKCDKGIEYCKICPNEYVCTELEKDDFGLENSTISDVLTAIQLALNKVPGYLNSDKRNELWVHIKNYINESPVHERGIWEDSILDILLDEKLANPSYKPKVKIGEVRTLLTYNSKVSFSTSLKCLCPENEGVLPDNKVVLRHEVTLNSTNAVNQFIEANNINLPITHPTDRIQYCLEKNVPEIILRCNLNDLGLATALCYYAVRTKLPISENIAVTGGLDSQGEVLKVDSLDGRIETVLRELHFIDKIIIPKGSSCNIRVPENVKIIEVSNFEQAIDTIFKNDFII